MQSDPATLALRLRHQAGASGAAGGSGSGGAASDAAPALGWVADPAQEAQRLDAWVEQVEALHQVGAAPPCSKHSQSAGCGWEWMRIQPAACLRPLPCGAWPTCCWVLPPPLQEDASAAALAPAPPDLEALMQVQPNWPVGGSRHCRNGTACATKPAAPARRVPQAWTPEMQAHIESSPLPDPHKVGGWAWLGAAPRMLRARLFGRHASWMARS